MKNRRISSSYILLLLVLVLFLFSACRKNSDESKENSAAVSEILESEEETSFSQVENAYIDSDEVFAPSPVVNSPAETLTEDENIEESDSLEIFVINEKENTDIDIETDTDTETDALLQISTETEEEITNKSEEDVDKPFYEGLFQYEGYESYIVIDNTYSTFTLPECVSEEDVLAIAVMVSNMYPDEASLITMRIEDGTVRLDYPHQTDEYLSSLRGYVASEAELLLDKYPLESIEEEVISIPLENSFEVIDEVKPIYDERVSYQGIETRITLYTDHASLTIPQGFGEEEILLSREILREEYPSYTEFVTYSVSDDVLTLSYPRATDEFLLSALKVLFDEAVSVIDSYTYKEEVTSTSSEEKNSVFIEEKNVLVEDTNIPEEENSVTPLIEDEKGEEVTEEKGISGENEESSSPTQTRKDEESSSPTQTREKEEKIRIFSLAASASPKYSFNREWESPLVVSFALRGEGRISHIFALGFKAEYEFSAFLRTEAYSRIVFASSDDIEFYVLLASGASFGCGPNKGKTSFTFDCGLGLDYCFTSSFSLFGEVAYEWSKEPGGALSATLGLAYRF